MEDVAEQGVLSFESEGFGDAEPVVFDGAMANAELEGDFLAGEPTGEQSEDLLLGWGKPLFEGGGGRCRVATFSEEQ